jgi:hypothetical protein
VVRLLERETGENAVAEKFQHLATTGTQRRDDRLEDFVEQVDQHEARQGIGDRRKPANIGITERAPMLSTEPRSTARHAPGGRRRQAADPKQSRLAMVCRLILSRSARMVGPRPK